MRRIALYAAGGAFTGAAGAVVFLAYLALELAARAAQRELALNAAMLSAYNRAMRDAHRALGARPCMAKATRRWPRRRTRPGERTP